MYVVTREGVYIQGITGLFDDLKEALDAAIFAIGSEVDDYHNFRVYKCPVNQNAVTKRCEYPIDAQSFDDWVYEVKRSGLKIETILNEP